MTSEEAVPEDIAGLMRQWSNWGHWAEGGLLGVVGVVAILEAAGALSGGWQYLWPAFLVVAGLLLPAVIFGHGHEDYENLGGRAAVWRDPQQRQHLVMGGILALGGLAEIAARASDLTILRYVWPVGLGVVGLMFFFHTQHGDDEAARKAVTIHRILGGTIVLAAVARLIEVAIEAEGGFWAYAWAVLLLVTSAQLLIYREPEGAYSQHGHG